MQSESKLVQTPLLSPFCRHTLHSLCEKSYFPQPHEITARFQHVESL